MTPAEFFGSTRLFFWNAADQEKKLSRFKDYFNQARVHQGLAGITPNQAACQPPQPPASLHDYHWKSYCDGLFELPIAA
jgi:putative transposase